MVYVVSWVGFQVDIHETIVRAPDRTSDTWPGILDTEDTFDVIAMQFFAGSRIHNGRFNSKEREGCAARFGGCSVRKRSNDVRSSFRLPVSLLRQNLGSRGVGFTSTTAHRSFPTIFLYHFQTSGAIGSPTDPRTRKLERSWWKC